VVDVGALADFVEAVPAVVTVEGREVVVVRWKGELFALRNVCPHQSQRFVHGTVCHDLTSTLDGELTSGEAILVCPWHNWPFDLRTGQCTVDALKRVKVFDVRVVDNRVLIGSSPSEPDNHDPARI
jgi:3-phenylpropionate/trans-cinnamate dioxygenase ferredoxin subunit